MPPKLLAALALTGLCALVPLVSSVEAQSAYMVRDTPVLRVEQTAKPPVTIVENTFYVTQGIEVDERLLPIEDPLDIPAADLAPGVGLDPTGVLYGTPKRPGTYTTPVTLCRGLICVEERITVIVHRNLPWEPGELTFPGKAGSALNGEIGINGGPPGVLPTFTVTNVAALPYNVSIGPDGHVGGIPSGAGVSQIPVRVCVAGSCAGVVVTLIVA